MQAQQGPSTAALERWAWPWVVLLMVVHTLIHLNSTSVLDTARDVFTAWQLARGAELPMQGPVLAGAIHLGPLWYYVLAVPLLVSSNWIAVTLWSGLLASLQYPLAYVLGRKLAGPVCGMIFAGLCTMPGWNIGLFLVSGHTGLVATCSLLILLCLVYWRRTGHPAWVAALPLATAIGIHAHPTVAAVGLAAVVVVLAGARARPLPWRWIAAGCVLAVLPFVPYLLLQAQTGWPDAATSGSYLAGQSPLSNLAALPVLLLAVLFIGPVAAHDVILGLGAAGWLTALAQIALFLLGLIAAARLLRVRGVERETAATVLAVAGITFAGVALLRDVTPFYMTSVMYTATALAAAWGLSTLTAARGIALGLAIVAPLLLSFILVRTTDHALQGRQMLPGAMSNVQRLDMSRKESLVYFPAWGRRALADLLCGGDQPVTLHGTGSIVLEQSYALEVHMRCPGRTIYRGGQAAGRHYLGLPRPAAARLGVTPGHVAGGLALVTATPLHGPASPLPPPTGHQPYPPRPDIPGDASTREYILPARQDQWLAITNLHAAWMAWTLDVTLNDRPVEPVWYNRHLQIFGCTDCDDATWSITITAREPAAVEIVAFQ